ncbi:MAG: FAD-binding protein, partial [Maritimibacter sp.]|nr:FAD-binding protein [Maritimibacter sp.]
MANAVPQDILDALTDVAMPRLAPEPPAVEVRDVAGLRLPVYRTGCLVVGSGAAGLRAAVELKRRGGAVTVVSQSAWGGTSACSGSDKQTLHTANTADRGDDFQAMARAIRAGGAMDEDTAYVEAVGSPRMMASLQYLGLPLPQDRFGATLRYQTDHDETGRATSCGPRTSRLMVKVLAEEALRLGVPLFNQTTVVRILTEGDGEGRRAVGVLAMRKKARAADNPNGLALFLAPALVLAAGGPGELYRDSVYPNGCYGSLGLALEAGIELVNLTESQFGIGTRREGFPWNLSGTYVQAMPHIYSVDAAGTEHHFLARYYRSTQELASNVFRKGYQWPFHASRMLDFASSLVDLAIWRESAAGRRVYMDFNRNPLAVPGDQPFGLDRLDADVSAYLGSAGATQAMPIDRLRHMNPLAIELYRRYKVDIAAEPLEFAVNNQHMNGGIAVDIWGRSSRPGIYAVGEAAGTHGVTRPGGSALNAGQVFGTRVAEHVAATGRAQPPDGAVPVA